MSTPPAPRVTQTLSFAVAALDRPRQQACASFRAWIEEAGRARAEVEARARLAVADCYRFGMLAHDEPEAFESLCKVLGIRQTRQDRAANPFIRVVKAVFGRTIEDGKGGPPRWEWISDSQVNKYATVLLYAHQRGISVDEMVGWLETDWNAGGEPVPMSLSRRLKEAREAQRGSLSAGMGPVVSLAGPAQAAQRAEAFAKVTQALDLLPPEVELTPLALRGLGAPDDAALIVALGDDQAVRLSHLPPEVLLEVVSTISRYYQRQPRPHPAVEPAFAKIASLLRQALPTLGAGCCVRLVNHQEWCSVIAGSSLDAPLLRAEVPALPGIPRRRVFVLTAEQCRALVQAYAPFGHGRYGEDSFQESNFSRSAGLLEQRIRVQCGDHATVVPILEVPAAVASEVADRRVFALGDIGITSWDAFCPLGRGDLAALSRLDSRAARWKDERTTRTGRDVIRRASRILELSSPTPQQIALRLRRGPSETVLLPVSHGQLPPDRLGRIGRASLGAAARLLIRRNTTDDAALLMAHGRLWLLCGTNRGTGERLFAAIPAVDEKGKTVGRGVREARFEPDNEPYSVIFDRAIRKLGVEREHFPAMGISLGRET